MADDLKTTLTKCGESRGRKTYAFAYLAGKRKDKKGEGRLEVVPGRKNYKKEDLGSDLESPGTFYQGKCWGDSEGQTIFFGCNALNPSIVDKLKFMVNKVTNKSFDLQLPDEDEQKRQAALEAAELEAERHAKSGEESTESPPSGDAAPTASGTIPKAPPNGPQAAKTSVPEKKPAVDPAAKSYEALLAGIDGPFKELALRDAATADKIQKILDAAATHAKPGEYAKAVGFLKEAGKLLAAATPSAGTERANEIKKEIKTEGVVSTAVLRTEIQTIRANAIRGLDALESELRDTDDPDAEKIADAVRLISADLPAELEVALTELEQGTQSQDSGRIKAAKTAVQQAAKQWMDFLTAHAEPIDGCENNPWGIPVAIATPVRNSLKAVLKVTA